MVDNSSGSKPMVVIGIDVEPQKSSAVKLWKATYIEGEVLSSLLDLAQAMCSHEKTLTR